MPKIFVTALHPRLNLAPGTTQTVTDDVALRALADGWGVLSDTRIDPHIGPPSAAVKETTGLAWTPLSPHADGSNYILSMADDGKSYVCTAALGVTLPLGLPVRPTVVFLAPPTGNLSVTGVLNGSQQTLTRSRATNPGGVALTPYTDVDGAGLSGS